MEIVRIPEVDSTNNWIAAHETELPSPCLVMAHTQYHGRGQRGNSWESQPGKNFTGSLLFHPQNYEATSQFLLSEAIALSVIDTLQDYGIRAKVKWPNDIYVGDKKICGILTENIILGKHINRTISGIGINVNQEIFISDAPNPVSMKNILGKEFDLDQFSCNFANHIEKNLQKVNDRDTLHSRFMNVLWRFDGNFHPFIDRKNGEHISGKIKEVALDGFLTLEIRGKEARQYAFKEIEFVI